MLESDDKPLLPAVLEALSPTEALLTISEGRYHQVRRMFAAVGNHVEALHRDRVGGLGPAPPPADLAAGQPSPDDFAERHRDPVRRLASA